jgi:hypothetical protein
MKRIIIAVLIAIAASGCAQTSSPSDTKAEQAMLQPAQYPRLVGKWQFVYDDARRAAVESQLSAKISDPAELARAKKEAEEESAISQIEFTADRQYVSRIGNEEILRAKIDMTPKNVGLELRDENTLVMHDPDKGDLIFARVK